MDRIENRTGLSRTQFCHTMDLNGKDSSFVTEQIMLQGLTYMHGVLYSVNRNGSIHRAKENVLLPEVALSHCLCLSLFVIKEVWGKNGS